MRALVKVEDLRQRYGNTTVIDGITLEIPEGSYVVLLGPSGSGKTTLLNILGGFVQPTSGRVMIDGADVTSLPPAERPTATVFQDYALFPHMSVGSNVGFGLRMRGVGRAAREARSREVLRLVGLEHVIGRKPHELSGGQRQRVALARALIIEPKLLLLDEPLGALDLKLRRQMQDELKALRKRVGTTFVHVTHDQEEAMALADVVAVVNHGRIEDMGPPDRVYGRPASRFTATFMGESTLFDGTVTACGDRTVRVAAEVGEISCPGFAKPGEKVTLAIRPESFRLDGRGQAIAEVEVQDFAFQGSFIRVVATTSGGKLIHLRLEPGTPVKTGDRIMVSADPGSIVLLTR